jgi:hypothetical protein
MLCFVRNQNKNLDAASLWRGNTFFTAVIESVIRLTCSHFLALSLRELVTEIAALNKEPLKMEKLVSDYVLQALCSMNNTADLFPKVSSQAELRALTRLGKLTTLLPTGVSLKMAERSE